MTNNKTHEVISSRATAALPTDPDGSFIGRVWDHERQLPVPVLFSGGAIWDASGIATTVSSLLESEDLLNNLIRLRQGSPTWRSTDVRTETEEASAESRPMLLAPVDLQPIKACGVTFAGSMLERVIEERSEGDPRSAREVRERMRREIGHDLAAIRPGSAEAERAKHELSRRGWWSQYLEVGLGPDPEVFTKALPLSSVGSGSRIGIPTFSSWNNPEPELVLLLNSRSRIVGVTLGNDVNLRDVEGRSALLLGMAKDNNRSTTLGPFIRLFDEKFSIDDARDIKVFLTVEGIDGFRLSGLNSVAALSRPFEELAAATMGKHHQYPDGVALFTGTLFTPTDDRDIPGEGFTHKIGDIVTISAQELGSLINPVGRTEELDPWTYGIRRLYADMHRLEGDRRLRFSHCVGPSEYPKNARN